MIGQGVLFSVVDIEDDLISKIVSILGMDPKNWGVDDPGDWLEVDDFVCDAIRDYIRRYWNE